MNEFDIKAAGWDNNPMHLERSKAVAGYIIKMIPLNRSMRALEFGAGTGSTSLLLSQHLKEIVMMDNSEGMVKMMNEKIIKSGTANLKALYFDLENNDFKGPGFDLIFTQMALHHVKDVNLVLRKFKNILNKEGYLAIADLYREDGSFHGEGFEAHNGFDPDELAENLEAQGFSEIFHTKCFTLRKDIPGKGNKEFDIFFLSAKNR